MTKLASIVIAVSLALTASFAASAEDTEHSATLRVDSGSVMTSEGGEFATARSGQTVAEGHRLMVHADSAATVIFDEDCEHEYTKPGVYTIERNCKRGAYIPGSASGFVASGAASIISGSLGVAAILHNMEGSDERPQAPPPVSY